MENMNSSKKKSIILSVVIGSILIASGATIFGVLAFTSPKYLVAYRGKDVTKLPDNNNDGSLNFDKYYSVLDDRVSSFLNVNNEDTNFGFTIKTSDIIKENLVLGKCKHYEFKIYLNVFSDNLPKNFDAKKLPTLVKNNEKDNFNYNVNKTTSFTVSNLNEESSDLNFKFSDKNIITEEGTYSLKLTNLFLGVFMVN